ncbi:hypothetical protein R6Z07F_002219 [Ovis aries]
MGAHASGAAGCASGARERPQRSAWRRRGRGAGARHAFALTHAHTKTLKTNFLEFLPLLCAPEPGPEVRPGSQRASSQKPEPQSIPGAPRAGARLAGPCSGGRSGAPRGGSAPCEKARDAPATVNGAARQDTLSP